MSLETWFRDLKDTLSEMYWTANSRVMEKRIAEAKARSKKKRLQQTFKAGVLDETRGRGAKRPPKNSKHNNSKGRKSFSFPILTTTFGAIND